MEREAFRLRMQLYKLARELNPLLKYWDWKKYADGGEVKDNTYVAPVYKENTFIPASGARKTINEYLYNYGSKSPYKGGELEIVSPEFDILTGARGIVNSIPSNTLRPTANVTDELNRAFIKRQTLFGKNSGMVTHVDYGDMKPGFAANTTGSTVVNNKLVPGHNPKSDIDYSWWNADKPYSYGIDNKPFTRYMTANELDIPGMITVRNQDKPIGQWNGKSGFVSKSEKVTSESIPMKNVDTFEYDPITRTYGKVKYEGYADGGTIGDNEPERPITNFNPKGNPYTPLYGYNPGAGYTRSVFDLYDAPVIGDALSIYDTGEALYNKDWLGAGLSAAAMLPFVPRVGKKTLKKIDKYFEDEAAQAYSSALRSTTKAKTKPKFDGPIPTVAEYKNSINQLLNRILGIDIPTLKLESEWNNLVNREIEKIYDPAVRTRASKLDKLKGTLLQYYYDDLHNHYTNNYDDIPKVKVVDGLVDNEGKIERARMTLKPEAAERLSKTGLNPSWGDYEMRVDRSTPLDPEVAQHEIAHFNQYMNNNGPDLNKLPYGIDKNKHMKPIDASNPEDASFASYFLSTGEQSAYQLNIINNMLKKGIPVTQKNYIKYVKGLRNDDSKRRAVEQFKTYKDAYKWTKAMPLTGIVGANLLMNYDNTSSD